MIKVKAKVKADILEGFTCKGCGLKSTATLRVPGRGVWPAQVLFIGESPNKTEDVLGVACVGQSGRLLERAMKDAEQMGGAPIPSYYVTSVVACRPCDGVEAPNREPSSEEVIACWPRLQHTVRKVNPRQIVLLGKVAQKFCRKQFPGALMLVHPAYVLRSGGVTSSVYRAFIRGLSCVFQEAQRKGDLK